MSELPRIQRASLRDVRRNQESAHAQGVILERARPDAVVADLQNERERSRDAGTGRYSALSADTPSSDGGALRVSVLSAAEGRPGLAVRNHRPCRSWPRGRV